MSVSMPFWNYKETVLSNLSSNQRLEILYWLKKANHTGLNLNDTEHIKAVKWMLGRLRGFLDRQDDINELNERIEYEFNLLFKTNLLFFLMVIGDYSLFLQYWFDFGLSKEQYLTFINDKDVDEEVTKFITSPPLKIYDTEPIQAAISFDSITNSIEEYRILRRRYENNVEQYRNYHLVIFDNTARQMSEIITNAEAVLNEINEMIETEAVDIDTEEESMDVFENLRVFNQENENFMRQLSDESKKLYLKEDGTVDVESKRSSVKFLHKNYEAMSTRFNSVKQGITTIHTKLNIPKAFQLADLAKKLKKVIVDCEEILLQPKKLLAEVNEKFLPLLKNDELCLSVENHYVVDSVKRYFEKIDAMLNQLEKHSLTSEQNKFLARLIDRINHEKSASGTLTDLHEQSVFLDKFINRNKILFNQLDLMLAAPDLLNIDARLLLTKLMEEKIFNSDIENQAEIPQDTSKEKVCSARFFREELNVIKNGDETDEKVKLNSVDIPKDHIDDFKQGFDALEDCNSVDLKLIKMIETISYNKFKKISFDEIDYLNEKTTLLLDENPQSTRLMTLQKVLTDFKENFENHNTLSNS